MKKLPLSLRQEAVFKLIREGYLVSEIATKLNVAESWIQVHIVRIMNKGYHINMVPNQIVRDYKNNHQLMDIALRYGVPESRVSRTVSRLIRQGRLKKRPHITHLNRHKIS